LSGDGGSDGRRDADSDPANDASQVVAVSGIREHHRILDEQAAGVVVTDPNAWELVEPAADTFRRVEQCPWILITEEIGRSPAGRERDALLVEETGCLRIRYGQHDRRRRRERAVRHRTASLCRAEGEECQDAGSDEYRSSHVRRYLHDHT